MTDRTKLTVPEAIRVLRNTRHTDSRFDAIADVFESLYQSQPSEPEDGKAPDPLPAVLPEGTRARNGAILRGVAALRGDLYFGDWRSPAGVQERDGYKRAEGGLGSIDWKEYRRTHYPEPKREPWAEGRFDHSAPSVPDWRRTQSGPLLSARWVNGRHTGPLRDADISSILAAMPAERRIALVGEFGREWERVELTRLKQRVEAAEARVKSLEGQLSRESRQHGEALDRHLECEKELEAARARVGELEQEVAGDNAEIAASRARIHQLTDALERLVVRSAPFAHTKHGVDGDMLRPAFNYAKMVIADHPLTRPTPSAPTPAVARGTMFHCREHGGYGFARDCVTCAEESPPRDSGGETAWPPLLVYWFNELLRSSKNALASLPEPRHAAQDELARVTQVAEAVPAFAHFVGRQVGKSPGVHDAGHGAATRESEAVAPPAPTPDESARLLAAFDEGFRAGRGYQKLSSAGREHREMREGDVQLITIPDNRELTHRVYEEARHQSGDLNSATFYKLGHDEALVRWVVEIAHSEGAKAAKAEGERVAGLLAKARAAAKGGFHTDVCVHIVRELEALAAELETGKA